MSHNPYSPPRAHVVDVEAGAQRARPVAVVRAVWLLSIALGMDLLGSVVESLLPDPEFSTGERVLILVISSGVILAVYVWLLSAAWKGRGWSRIVQLVLVVLGFATNYVLSLLDPEAFDMPTYVSAIYWVATLIEAAGLALLFAPSANAWYRSMRRN